MTGNEKSLAISFEQDMPAVAGAAEKYVIPMSAISRRTFLVGGTAVGASPSLGQMAGAENFGGVAICEATAPGFTARMVSRS